MSLRIDQQPPYKQSKSGVLGSEPMLAEGGVGEQGYLWPIQTWEKRLIPTGKPQRPVRTPDAMPGVSARRDRNLQSTPLLLLDFERP